MLKNRESEAVVIETNQRLSHSIIWELQRQYFDDLGVNAWVGAVPFFVTSNQVIAQKYAETAFYFMNDWRQQHPETADQPFYFIELGAGTGQFGYYVLLHLNRLLNNAKLKETLNFCYVMSDFTEHNIQFWMQQPCLQRFVEAGQLDFGLFNIEDDDKITLRHSKVVLQKQTCHNPIIVFANYVFDTVANDAFHVSDNKLYELLISVKTHSSNVDAGRVLELDHLEHSFNTHHIKNSSYYDNVALDTLLGFYKDTLNNSYFLIPITGIRALENIASFSDGQLLVLSSDKSFTALRELENLNKPYIAFHGSFSLDVNFDAISRYTQYRGGSAFVPAPKEGLRTVAFGFGMDFSQMPLFYNALANNLDNFPASSWYLVYRYIKENPGGLDIKHLVSFMNLCQWDPYIFDKLIEDVAEKIPQQNNTIKNELRAGLVRLVENYYLIPQTFDTYFQVGLCYYHLGDVKQAIHFQLLSLEIVGENYRTLNGLGLCYQAQNSAEQAKLYFDRASAC